MVFRAMVSVLILLMSRVCFASAFTVESKGADDDEALKGVCRKALAAYVADRVGEKPFEENREKLMGGMIDSCSDYVSNIEVLDRSEAGGEVVIKGRAIVEDVVALARLKELGVHAEARRTVVVFASERIMGDWIGSYFNSISDDDVAFNTCEAVVGQSLREKGFDEVEPSFDAQQKKDARRFKTVFGRYMDVSSVPNNTVSRASEIVGADARYVIACSVLADSGSGKDSAFMYTCCAEGSCKVVDTKTKRRVATASESSCNPNANRTTGSMAAIRAVCKNMGDELGKKIEDLYLNE